MRRRSLFAALLAVALLLTTCFRTWWAGSAPAVLSSDGDIMLEGLVLEKGAGTAPAGGRTARRSSLFCYAFADPRSETLPLLLASLALACDEHAIFTTAEAKAKLFQEERTVLGLWTKAEFEKSWGFNLLLPMQRVWRYVLALGADFDWVVKLDGDSWVRPATFRELFDIRGTEHPRRDTTIISFGTATLVHGEGDRLLRAPVAARAGENALLFSDYGDRGSRMSGKARAPVKATEALPQHRAYDREMFGHGPLTDGPFIAVSHAAARVLARQQLRAGDMCAARLLAGHDCPPLKPGAGSCGDGAKEAASCSTERTGQESYASKWGILRFVFPLDGRGYSMLSNGEPLPNPALLQRFSAADPPPEPWCTPTNQLWDTDERAFADLKAQQTRCQRMEQTCASQRVHSKSEFEHDNWVLTKRGLETPGCTEEQWKVCADMLSDGPFTRLSTPRGRFCLSDRLAIVHAVKDVSEWRKLDKAVLEETRAFKAEATAARGAGV